MNIKTDEEIKKEFDKFFIREKTSIFSAEPRLKSNITYDDLVAFLLSAIHERDAAIRERIEGMSVAFQQYLDVCRKLEKEPYPQHRTGVEASIVLGRVKNIHDDLLSLLTVENKQNV